jgi:hypothetical protein
MVRKFFLSIFTIIFLGVMFMSEFHFVPNGGINTYGEINDNQGSYGENVWYKGGLLQRDKISLLRSSGAVLDAQYINDALHTIVLVSNVPRLFVETTDIGICGTGAKAIIVPTQRTENGKTVLMIITDGQTYYTSYSSSGVASLVNNTNNFYVQISNKSHLYYYLLILNHVNSFLFYILDSTSINVKNLKLMINHQSIFFDYQVTSVTKINKKINSISKINKGST